MFIMSKDSFSMFFYHPVTVIYFAQRILSLRIDKRKRSSYIAQYALGPYFWT